MEEYEVGSVTYQRREVVVKKDQEVQLIWVQAFDCPQVELLTEP